MTSLRKALPLAKAIVSMALNVGLVLLVLDWALYLLGWIHAGQFIEGVQASYLTIGTGIGVAALWLLGARAFLDDQER